MRQVALPIVKKCGVFERKRSIFCRLPQWSHLLSSRNCSSNRTGSSAKDLICTRTIKTSSQYFLLSRILLRQYPPIQCWLARKLLHTAYLCCLRWTGIKFMEKCGMQVFTGRLPTATADLSIEFDPKKIMCWAYAISARDSVHYMSLGLLVFSKTQTSFWHMQFNENCGHNLRSKSFPNLWNWFTRNSGLLIACMII